MSADDMQYQVDVAMKLEEDQFSMACIWTNKGFRDNGGPVGCCFHNGE